MGGLFGVHTIDMGIVFIFYASHQKEKAFVFSCKAAVVFLYLQFLPCAFIFSPSPFPFFFLFFFSGSFGCVHCMASVKLAGHKHICAFGM